MQFNLKKLILLAAFVALITSLITSLLRTEPNQLYTMVAFSSDGKRIAVQGKRNTQVFECRSEKRLCKFRVFSDITPEHVEFADNQHVLTFGFGKSQSGIYRTVRWHDSNTGLEVRSLPRMSTIEHFSPARDGFVYSNNGTKVISYFSRDPHKTDPTVTGNLQASFESIQGYYHTRPCLHAYYNGTPDELLTNKPSWAHVTEVKDLAGDQGKNPVVELAIRTRFNPEGNRFAVENQDVFSMHNRKTGNVLWQANVNEACRTQFSANGKFVGVETYGESPTVHVFDSETGKALMQRVTVRDYMGAPFAISNDGVLAISRTVESKSGVELWDVYSGKQVGRVGVTLETPNWKGPSVRYSAMFLFWCVLWVLVNKRRFEGSWYSRMAANYVAGVFIIVGFTASVVGLTWFIREFQESLKLYISFDYLLWGNPLFAIIAFLMGSFLILIPGLGMVLGRRPINASERKASRV